MSTENQERFILRQEADGGGYLFDRILGQATPIPPEQFAECQSREGVRKLPVPEKFPEGARVAPFFAWMQLTYECPIKCRICSAFKKGPELSVNQWANVFDNMHQAGVFEARMTGGEPTKYPGFTEVVEAAAETGLYVSLNSSGVMALDLRKKLPELPIGLYVLSIDGPQKAHDYTRGRGKFSEVWETLQTLVDAGKNVRVNTVLYQANKDHLEEMGGMLKEAGIAGWTLVPLRPIGGAARNFDKMRLSRTQYGEALTEVRRLRAELGMDIAASYDTMSEGRIFNTPPYFEKRCAAGIEVVNVNPEGLVSACILHNAPEPYKGNVLEEPFQKIWADDSRWEEFRSRERLSQACRECDHFGADCAGTCLVIARHTGFPERDIYCQL